jgi:hypothetical protein
LMCLLALLMCLRGHGQANGVIQRVEAVLVPGASYMDITFSETVKVSSAERVSLYSLGDGTDEAAISSSQAEGLGGRPRMLRVFFAGNPPAGHAKLRVCLGSVEVGGTLLKDVCGEGRIARDMESEFARAREALRTLPKLQREKSLFASVFLGHGGGGTADGASTIGAADVSLVRSDFGSKDLNYFLRLKRGSVEGMDPRNMEAGASYRRSFLLHRGDRAKLAKLFSETGRRDGRMREATAMVEDLQKRWFAGHIVEAGVKLEGDAAGERQWLGLVDAGWSLQSTTRRVRLPGAPGWFRFRWLAGGLEAGREQARVKVGADAALLVQARGGAAPIRRLEFHAQSMNRWLARPERSERGVRPWVQMDAKAFLFESERVRYGVRLSVQRGSLPPVYEPVKSVQFGFVVESAGADQ